MNIEHRFDSLTPEAVICAVEEQLGIRCSNICRPLNSYINRVWEVQKEDGGAVIAKFYRPTRWSRDALRDEHDFLLELADFEVPVIAPLRNLEGETLMDWGDTPFALFEKKGGRIIDEPSVEQWRELGRLLARVHQVGEGVEPRDRAECTPESFTAPQVESLLSSGQIPGDLCKAFADEAEALLDLIDPLFDDPAYLRLHGDCHFQNLIFRPGEHFFIIDFDDMVTGPAVQDMWMLLPGRVPTSRLELEALLQGYETFRPFDRSELLLVEPLRAMRFIHYLAWCAHQAHDAGFSRLSPDWGTPAFWRQEIQELKKQYREIQHALR